MNRSGFRLYALVGALGALFLSWVVLSDPVPTVAASGIGAFGFSPGELVPDFDYKSVDSDGAGEDHQ